MARGQPLGWLDLFVGFLPAGLAVLAPLAYGLWRAAYAYTRFGPAAADAWARPWYLASTLALLPVLGLASYRLHLSRRFVAAHENGLRLRLSPFGGGAIPWEQVEGVAAGAVEERLLGRRLSTRPRLVLYLRGNRRIRLSGLRNLPALTRQIKSCLYPRLRPALFEQVQSGGWARFGPLAVHRRALWAQGRQIAWERLAGLQARSGFLVVELENGLRLREAIERIPNLELLLEVIEREANR